MAVIGELLLTELLEFVVNKVDLGADDDLDAGLAGTQNTGGTCSLDLLVVSQQTVLQFQSQTGDAVCDGQDVFFAADTFQNSSCHSGVILAAQLDNNFIVVNFLAGAGAENAEVLAVTDQSSDHGGVAGSLDGFDIELDQQIALLDLVAVLAVNGEVLAVQLNGIQTDVDQDFILVAGDQSHSVTGGEHIIDSGIAGSISLALGGDDADAVAQHILGKCGIGNLCHRHGAAGDGGIQFLYGITEQFLEECHFPYLLSLFSPVEAVI